MTSPTAFFFDERCLWHSAGSYAGTLPVGGWVQPTSSSGLAESPDSKRRLKSLMDVSGLTQKLHIRTAEMATEQDLLRVHTSRYLERFKQVSDAGGGLMGDEAPCGPGSYEIAKLSAGMAIEAVKSVLAGEYRSAYSLSRPPGHHCLPETSMGFCFLANIAVAIEAAQAAFGRKKVVVIDWDVHHGNGTQHIYYQREDVLTISLHQENCFPVGYRGDKDIGEGAGKGYNINIPLLAGSGHDAYMYAFERIVEPAIRRFKPDLIIVACGYDANGMDPLARMLLHSDSFRQMTERTMALASDLCDDRLVLVHEGGYSESYVPFCGHATLEALCGWRGPVQDPLLDFIHQQQPSPPHIQLQRSLLDEMARQFDL